MKRVGAQGLFSYAVFFLCLSVVLFARAGEWWEAPDWRPTSSDEKAFVQGLPGEHQFLAACRQGRVDVMEYWLSQKGFRPNDKFISGYTGKKVSGLRMASDCGHNDGLKLLIKAGADLNQATDDGATPLFIASQEGLVEVMEILVKAGADLNQTWNGATPLFKASHGGHVEVVEILVKAGADLNQTWNGATPLFQTSQNGHVEVVEILVKAGADLNQTWNGATPVFMASQNGHAEIAKILVDAGADLNQTWKGATPLFMASQNGHAEIAKILVDAGADLNQTWNGATPLFIASQNGHVEIVKILVKAGADPTRKWHVGYFITQSPLTTARHARPLLKRMNPEKHARYDQIIEILKSAVKVRKNQKIARSTGTTVYFDPAVDMAEIKNTVTPLMGRLSLKDTAQ